VREGRLLRLERWRRLRLGLELRPVDLAGLEIVERDLADRDLLAVERRSALSDQWSVVLTISDGRTASCRKR
jgi:hypothetical protein